MRVHRGAVEHAYAYEYNNGLVRKRTGPFHMESEMNVTTLPHTVFVVSDDENLTCVYLSLEDVRVSMNTTYSNVGGATMQKDEHRHRVWNIVPNDKERCTQHWYVNEVLLCTRPDHF